MLRSTLCLCIGVVAALVPTTGRAYLPDRAWGTYLGFESFSGENPAVAVAPDGAVHVCGTRFEPTEDVYLIRITADGQHAWTAVIGGPGHDECHNLAVDSAGNTIVVGETQSDAGISTPDGLQPVRAGDSDGFAVKVDPDGAVVWGTYVGGAAVESLHGVAVDAADAVYLAGWGGALGFALPGPHDPDFNGTTDIFLLKLAPDLALAWGTYYGGPNPEALPGVAVAGDAVYLVGNTQSATGVATPGAHDTTKNAADAFVARFDGDGVRAWGSYFGGEREDTCSSLDVTPDGGVALFGRTYSDSDIATPDAFQPTRLGAMPDVDDGMIARFDGQGGLLWATYIGAPQFHDSVGGGAVDPAGNVLYVGANRAAGGMSTPDAFQPKNASVGEWDLHIVKFDPGGARRWGTFLGSVTTEAVAAASAARPVAVDGLDAVYVVGYGGADDAIATEGTYLPDPGGTNYLVRLTQGAGLACSDPAQCETGVCVDGVCCDAACDGECVACSVAAGAAVDGLCAAIADDTPCAAGVCNAGVCERPGDETTGASDGTTSASDATGAPDETTGMAEGPVDTTSATSTPDPGPTEASGTDGPGATSSAATSEAPTGGAGEASSSSGAEAGGPPQGDAEPGGCACATQRPVSRDMLFAALVLLARPRRRAAARSPA